MKNIRAAILTVCLGTMGSMTALAQTGNTEYGTGALASNTYGSDNSAFGYDSLYSNTNGGDNSAFGYNSLYSNTNGYLNSAFGYNALVENTNGGQNAAFGVNALSSNTTGGSNTAVGMQALSNNTTGSYNAALGYNALAQNGGSGNVGMGYGSLLNNYGGSYDIAIGYNTGAAITTGSYNIDIGNSAVSSDSGVIRIGDSSNQNSFFAAGVYGVSVSGAAVYVNSSGQLGIVSSSIRFKEDVHDMSDASNAIFRLRPVTYRYKQAYADGSKPIDYGLIAEEVANVYPDLVSRDAKGEIQTVQYQKLTPMLLNELQKEHAVIEEMAKTMEQEQQTIQAFRVQQAETVRLLEKRLAALETGQPAGARLEATLQTK